MINYTHFISEYLVGIIGRKRNYSREEKIVITYGMELRINSATGSCTCGSLCKILGNTAKTNETYTA